jgi:hypothetical protein
MNPFFFSSTAIIMDHFEATARAHERMFDMMSQRMMRDIRPEPTNRDSQRSSQPRSLSTGHRRSSERHSYNGSSVPVFRETVKTPRTKQLPSVGVRRQYTLAREGINPLSTTEAQKKPASRHAVHQRKAEKVVETKELDSSSFRNELFNAKNHLGSGWHRQTAVNTGSITFPGLHTVIESFHNHTFLVIHESNCVHVNLSLGSHKYNLDFQFKLLPESLNYMNIIFHYHKEIDNKVTFFVLNFDFLQKTLSIYYCKSIPLNIEAFYSASTLVLQESLPSSFNIANHRFYKCSLAIDRFVLKASINNTVLLEKDCEPLLIDCELRNSWYGYMGLMLWKSCQLITKEFDVKLSSFGSSSSSTSLPIARETVALKNNLVSTDNVQKELDKNKPISLSDQLTLPSALASNSSGFKLEELRQGLLALNHDTKIIDIICNEILTINLGISFNDIAALEEPKRILNETVILPFLLPEFFTGMRQPWNGILLFSLQRLKQR